MLDEIIPEAGAFYVMDRGYIDFERLYVFTLSAAFFVVRTKENVLLQRRYSREVDKSSGLRSDHTVILTALNSAKAYPDAMRRVSYQDLETKKRFKFLTNNFALLRIPMMSISQSDLMPIRSERSDARLSQCESVIGIRQQFCSV